jgi:HEPN superfamily Swt1-like protein
MAAFVRWSQIEIWLRQLVHLELAAAYGRRWIGALGPKLGGRAARNAANAYMLSPDEESLLAYGDVTDLFKVIEDPDHWPFFEPSLVPKVRWAGWTDELRAIRNRIAHCRRPHADDVGRLELFLRNLEPGASIALRAYDENFGDLRPDDSIAKSWLGEEPPWAHIRDHARGQYKTNFHVNFSRRPWAATAKTATGTPGVLVHASWYVRDGFVFPHIVWPDLAQQGFDPALIVHYVQDSASHVQVVFSAVDSHEAVAEAIEYSFQAVLDGIERYRDNDSYGRWTDRAQELDPRCHINDAFAHSDRLSMFSVFNAESVKRP